MKIDPETEAGRTIWGKFRVLTIAFLYQDRGGLGACVSAAAEVLRITDDEAISRMYDELHNSGEKFERMIIRPFLK